MFVSEQDRAVNLIHTGCKTYLRNSEEYELWGQIKSKPNVQKYSSVNFPACIQLASDWFLKKQSGTVRLTHAQYREPVPLKSSNAPEVPQVGGRGGGRGC